MGVRIPLLTPKISGTYGVGLSHPFLNEQVSAEMREIHVFQSYSNKWTLYKKCDYHVTHKAKGIFLYFECISVNNHRQPFDRDYLFLTILE